MNKKIIYFEGLLWAGFLKAAAKFSEYSGKDRKYFEGGTICF